MIVSHQNAPDSVFEKHFTLTCPRCGVPANLSAVSIPRYEFLARFHPAKVGVVYRCDACNEPVFLRFQVGQYDLGNHKIVVADAFEEVEPHQETFEFAYLKGDVASDFREALSCYSVQCFNAFAAMCRRTVQSACSELGAQGKDRVLQQLQDLQQVAGIDDETFSELRQIVVEGHDGAHPHLPKLTSERATTLLELMKDVLYQLFVRKAKLQEAAARRARATQTTHGG